MKKYQSAKTIAIVFVVVIALIVANITYLGATGKHFLSGDNITEFARQRGKKSTIEYATRGQIYSSDKETIATNVKKYKIIAVLSDERPGYGKKAAHVTDIGETAEKLAPILNCEASVLSEKMNQALNAKKYQIEFGSIGRDLTTTQKTKIEELKLTGIEFQEYNGRYYPYGDFCSYMVGYTNSYEEKGVQKLVGQLGLELKYNKTLGGENGYKVYQIDKYGYALPDGILKSKKAEDGSDVYLTIDSSLQRDLDMLLNEAVTGTKAEFGICAVMEVKTGKLLAVSSSPSYNPNDRKLTNYTNYFTDATYECGSVFKPFVYATSIEEGKYSHTATYHSGTFQVGKNTIRDHNNGQGWGTITYDQGLFHSSNVAICNLLSNGMVTKDTLKKNLKTLGFFQKDDIDGIPTSGSVAGYEKTDSQLTYLTTGFGQGSTMTAYQLLKAYSVFGNNGKTVEPYIVDKVVNKKTSKVTYTGKTTYSEQIFSENTVNEMKTLMAGVVENPSGTGKNFKLDDGTRMFAKTGTGQISDGSGYRSDIAMHSFACLAPFDDPQIEVYLTLKCSNAYSMFAPKIIKTIVPEALQLVNQYNTNDASVASNIYKLDNFTNQSVAYIQNKLTNKKMNVITIGNGATVVGQYPLTDTKLSPGSKVFIKTDGTEIALPNMSGYSRKEASTYGSLSGINITFQGSGTNVTAQSVPESTVVHAGDNLTLTLSE